MPLPSQPSALRRLFSRKLAQGAAIGLGAAALAIALWTAGVVDLWEYPAWKWRVHYFAHPSPASGAIKLILLDQASLDWGKQQNGWSWPWPREAYGPILDFCKRGGAKVVAFDVVYTEPSVYGVADDSAFGAAIARGPAFIGALQLSNRGGQQRQWPVEFGRALFEIPGLDSYMSTLRSRGADASVTTFPVREVAGTATLLGNVSGQPDPDGIFRRAHLFTLFDGHAVPSLGCAAFLAGTTETPLSAASNHLTLHGIKLPVDNAGRLILRYAGPSGTYTRFSAAAILQSELRLREGGRPTIDPRVLKDSYVFFGFSAPGLLDFRPTPLSKMNPGVEIHATALDNLLAYNFLGEAPAWLVVLAVLLLTLLSGIAVVKSKRASFSVIVFTIALPLPVIAGFASYAAGYWFPIMASLLGVLTALVAGIIVDYATEGRKKAYHKRAFRHYLGAEVIEQLISDPAKLQLGGEKRELTIFFSDIEKFSSFSERLDPPVLTALLNDFLSDMTDIILAEGGYLDKYIGDAIVAFWNAPLTQGDHAARACRAALRCQRKLAERRQEFFERTGATIKMRVGIHTGPVTVGNMGSRERFNYTVLGDAANLASRLEGANKSFGTYAMVSGATWEQTKGAFLGRELGRLRVVGREAPVQVFELVGLAGEPLSGHFPRFANGLELFYKGRFADSLSEFKGLPGDPAAVSYARRCVTLAAQSMDNWDGVVNLTEK
jgi:adenylate cyclase